MRAEPGLADLPILVHGYDRAIPGGFPGDTRNPIYASQTQWLGEPMQAHGITEPGLQREIIGLLIDELYAMLGRVAADSRETKVFVVDARGAIGDDRWNDEIHGNDLGFATVADRFRAVLETAMTS